MSIGERIKFFRNLRGMSQKEFGILAEFPPRSADIRIAQYESGTRTPRGNILERLAYYLKVTPTALEVPSFESDYHFMHTLFMLEDKYGFEIEQASPREITLKLKTSLPPKSHERRLEDWAREYQKFKTGEITKEEYDQWRYTYPKVELQRFQLNQDEFKFQTLFEEACQPINTQEENNL